ncbi:hypothetical protein KIPB_006133, partial [Kipferlia bialata]
GDDWHGWDVWEEGTLPGIVEIVRECRTNGGTKLSVMDLFMAEGETKRDEDIVSLADALYHLPDLQKLFFSSVQLVDKDIEVLSESIGRLKDLKELTVMGDPIGDTGVRILASCVLPKLTDLTMLNLGLVGMTDTGAAALAEALPYLTNLEMLYIFRNKIGDSGARAMAKTLPRLTGLKTFLLTNNLIGPIGRAALAEALSWLSCGQQDYIDPGFQGWAHWETEAKSEIVEVVNECRSNGGTHLKCDGVHMSAVDVVCLSQALLQLADMEKLSLSGITHKTGVCGIHEHLTPAIGSLTNLTELRIVYYPLDSCVFSLSEVLRNMTRLTLLDLSGSEVSCDHVSHLCDALPHLPCLDTLILSHNEIGDEGAMDLAVALPQLPSLKSVWLEDNLIGAQGKAALAETTIVSKLQCMTGSVIAPGIGFQGWDNWCLENPDLASSVRDCLDDDGDKHLSLRRLKASEVLPLTESLPYMHGLEALDLHGVQTHDWDMAVLFSAIGTLKGLTEFGLSGVQIGESVIIALTEALGNLNALSWLSLNGTMIGDIGALCVSKYLPKLTEISMLDLRGNGISDKGAMALAQALPLLTGLTALHLSDNQIGAEGTQALTDAILSMPSLEDGAHIIGWQGWDHWEQQSPQHIVEGVKRCRASNGYRLEFFVGVELGDDVSSLSAALLQLPDLRRLSLVDCIRGPALETLVSAIRNLTSLQSLDLSLNDMCDSVASQLAESLSSLKGLRTLSLQGNSIGDPGAIALSKTLLQLRGLTNLEMEDNRIGHDGTVAMQLAMAHLPKLQSGMCAGIGWQGWDMWERESPDEVVDIMRAWLGGEDLSCVSPLARRMMQKMDGDTHDMDQLLEMSVERDSCSQLSLSGHSIGDEGVEAVAKILPKLLDTLELDLSNTGMSDAGAVALAGILASLRNLHKLDLSNNCVGHSGSVAISKALERLKSLQEFSIENNEIGPAAARYLHEGLSRGPRIKLELGHQRRRLQKKHLKKREKKQLKERTRREKTRVEREKREREMERQKKEREERERLERERREAKERERKERERKRSEEEERQRADRERLEREREQREKEERERREREDAEYLRLHGREEIQSLKETNASLRSDLETERNRANQAEIENARLMEKVATLESTLERERDREREREFERQRQAVEVAALKKEVAILKDRNQTLSKAASKPARLSHSELDRLVSIEIERRERVERQRIEREQRAAEEAERVRQ